MKIKPTKLKTLTSLIISFIVGLWLMSQQVCFDCSRAMLLKLSIYAFFMGFVLFFVLIYGIWSIFQDNSEKKSFFYFLWRISLVILIDFILSLLFVFLMKSF